MLILILIAAGFGYLFKKWGVAWMIADSFNFTGIKFVKVFMLQLLIPVIYLAIIFLEFVFTNNPNPIGIGFQQILLIAFHICMVLFMFLFLLLHQKKEVALINLVIQSLTLFVVLFLYSNWECEIWDLLWSLRGN